MTSDRTSCLFDQRITILSKKEINTLGLNDDSLIRIPALDTKENYLDGFWRWVERLEREEYASAIAALYWPESSHFTADSLKDRILTFFGGDEPWSVVIPNQRLIDVINEAAEFEPPIDDGRGWLMAMIPLTTNPQDPKDDKIPLMGLAASFFVRKFDSDYVFEFEIFHA